MIATEGEVEQATGYASGDGARVTVKDGASGRSAAFDQGARSSCAGRSPELLMLLVSRGHRRAMDELVERYRDDVVAHAAQIVGWDAAEDVAQEVFVRVWILRERWRPTGSVSGYLYRITRNLSLNRKRSDASRSERDARFDRETHTASPTPADRLEQKELRQRMLEAIRRLPPKRREVLVRARLHSMSYADIAATMAISNQTVANHLTRATADLRQLFSDL